MKKCLFLLTFFALAAAQAFALPSSADEDALKSILAARSYSQLRHTAERGHKLRRANLVCDAQLRGNRIPVACFDVLNFESVDVDTVGSAHGAGWLESVCSQRAASTRDWRELNEASRNRLVPKKCRAAAETRLADLQYADQSEHPADLFQRRFETRMQD
jgi:hypothetical protein